MPPREPDPTPPPAPVPAPVPAPLPPPEWTPAAVGKLVAGCALFVAGAWAGSLGRYDNALAFLSLGLTVLGINASMMHAAAMIRGNQAAIGHAFSLIAAVKQDTEEIRPAVSGKPPLPPAPARPNPSGGPA